MKNRLLLCILPLVSLLSLPDLSTASPLPDAPAIELREISPLDGILQAAEVEASVLARFDAVAPVMEKNIIAKLHCESVLVSENSETPKFRAVYGDSEENKSFSKYTPSASLELSITNPQAMGFFKPGQDYLVTITSASVLDAAPDPV